MRYTRYHRPVYRDKQYRTATRRGDIVATNNSSLWYRLLRQSLSTLLQFATVSTMSVSYWHTLTINACPYRT